LEDLKLIFHHGCYEKNELNKAEQLAKHGYPASVAQYALRKCALNLEKSVEYLKIPQNLRSAEIHALEHPEDYTPTKFSVLPQHSLFDPVTSQAYLLEAEGYSTQLAEYSLKKCDGNYEAAKLWGQDSENLLEIETILGTSGNEDKTRNKTTKSEWCLVNLLRFQNEMMHRLGDILTRIEDIVIFWCGPQVCLRISRIRLEKK